MSNGILSSHWVLAPRVAVTLAAAVLPLIALAATPLPPNILLILADDLRSDAIHTLGNSEIHTPNIDQLVQRGFHFTNAYCMGSMTPAVCLPSRTMLLTGRSVWHLPPLTQVEPPPNVPLLPLLLADAGYATFHCGKSNNACRYGNAAFQLNIETEKHDAADMHRHGDAVIKFLSSRDRAKPFLVYLAPPVPHDPRVAPQRFVDMYRAEELSLPRNFTPAHPFDNGELNIRDELLAAKPRDPAEMRRHLAEYYACVTDLDHEVGRIIAALEADKALDDTVVIFTSDQGLAVGGRHGLMGKQNLYEHVKPPLVFAGPGIPSGKSAALTYLYDLFPTVCKLAGAYTPAVAEGADLLPIIRGERTRNRETLFAAYRECQRMIRDDRWKLIEYNAAGVRNTQLFDLNADPDELHNLAADSTAQPQLTRLRNLLTHQSQAFQDPVNPWW